MSDETMPAVITIDPPLTLDDVKDGPELRTIELIHLRANGASFPVEPWTANTIHARDSGMNYRPEFIADELQQVVDYYADREFAGFIEVRNSSSSQAPVARYYVRGRRVKTVTPALVWPGEPPRHYVLDLPMGENDARARTIREYLIALLSALWDEQEGFSGKRPFGNSGWDCDLLVPLIRGGLIDGRLDEDGYIEEIDDNGGEHLIAMAIEALGGLGGNDA